MIQAGKSVLTKGDTLKKIEIEYLYNSISKPKADLESHIRQLRMVREIDQKRYSQLKRNLPYIVTGIFNPPVRRTENFSWIQYFVLDIDHVNQKEESIELLKERLQKDTRLVLMFVSPSEDGLKLFFCLDRKCYDSVKYSIFYKLFLNKFALEYDIPQLVDSRTSDVTRACFICPDPQAYYNPLPVMVNMDAYADFSDMGEIKKTVKLIKEEKKKTVEVRKAEIQNTLSDDVLIAIKKKLNPNFKEKIKKDYYVPPQLNDIINDLSKHLLSLSIEIESIDNISYGKKMKLLVESRRAEINIFYGKRGYSVVISPKRGTDDEFNKVAAQAIKEFFIE